QSYVPSSLSAKYVVKSSVVVMGRDYQNLLFANKANLFSPAKSGEKRVLLSRKVCDACAKSMEFEDSRNRIFLPQRRKDANFGTVVISTGGGNLLRSLAIARDEASAFHLCAFAEEIPSFGCTCSPTGEPLFPQRSLGKSMCCNPLEFPTPAQILLPRVAAPPPQGV
ncbi:MAG: hypothetical protein ACXWZE_18465, partial [Candidatus Binatia bacterium]